MSDEDQGYVYVTSEGRLLGDYPVVLVQLRIQKGEESEVLNTMVMSCHQVDAFTLDLETSKLQALQLYMNRNAALQDLQEDLDKWNEGETHRQRSHRVSKVVHLSVVQEDESWVQLDRFGEDDPDIFLEVYDGSCPSHVCVILTEAQAKELYNGLFTAIYGTRPAWVPPHESAKVQT